MEEVGKGLAEIDKAGQYMMHWSNAFKFLKLEPELVKRDKKPKRFRSLPCYIGCGGFCRKYFWEGQVFANDGSPAAEEVKGETAARGFVKKYRRLIALAIPTSTLYFVWLSVMTSYGLWHLFLTRWQMTVTMVFGGIVAGMTSEGGGAVAFPVMTLLLHASAAEGRDMALFVQATGMSCAAFAIIFMGIQVEWHAVALSIPGGIIGMLFGFYYIDPYVPATWKKMMFVSVWFSFAFTLFLLNNNHKRKTYRSIPDFKMWKGIALFAGGIIGGLMTSIAGGGVDICVFSILTLLFRVTEKTATPTSVIMMAMVSNVGVFWRVVIVQGVTQLAYEYYAVCAEMPALFAPIGAILGSHFHRQVLACCVYILDTASLILAFIIIPQTPLLAGASVGIIVFGFVFFFCLTKLGQKQIVNIEKVKIQDVEDTLSSNEKYKNGQVIIIENGVINEGYSEDSRNGKENQPEIRKITSC